MEWMGKVGCAYQIQYELMLGYESRCDSFGNRTGMLPVNVQLHIGFCSLSTLVGVH